MSPFTHKLVAIINEKLAPGVAMNALAHMSFGLGASLEKELCRLSDYRDSEGGSYPNISDMPFIILKANASGIRRLRNECINANIAYTCFTDTMTIGTHVEQQARTRQLKEDELVFYGITICGPWDAVTTLTKKFSLWK